MEVRPSYPKLAKLCGAMRGKFFLQLDKVHRVASDPSLRVHVVAGDLVDIRVEMIDMLDTFQSHTFLEGSIGTHMRKRL